MDFLEIAWGPLPSILRKKRKKKQPKKEKYSSYLLFLAQVTDPEFRTIHSKSRWNYISNVETLLDRGCSIDLVDENGNTPLLIAVQQGHQQLASMLVTRGRSSPRNTIKYFLFIKIPFFDSHCFEGANLNFQNNKGCCALHYAYAYGYPEIAHLLESAGADTTLKNDENKIPKEWEKIPEKKPAPAAETPAEKPAAEKPVALNEDLISLE